MDKFTRVIPIGLCVWLGLFSTGYAADAQQKAEPLNRTVLSALAQISAAGTAAQYDKAEQLFVKGKEERYGQNRHTRPIPPTPGLAA